MPNDKRRRISFYKPFFFVIAFGLLVWAVQYLWNWLIAPTFSVRTFGYFEAMGLFILCRLLFGSFRFGGQMRSGSPPFRNKEKWMNMSDEERQQFKAEWQKKCEKRSD